MSAAAARAPQVTAHSGCLGTTPNSRESVEAALRSGADIVEFDLRLSADGVVALSHESAVPDRRGLEIAGHSWSELLEASGGALLRLEDLLEICAAVRPVPAAPVPPGRTEFGSAGRWLNLDAKTPAAMARAVEVLDARRIADIAFFTGLGLDGIAAAAELGTERRYLFNADKVVPFASAEPDVGGAGAELAERACAAAALRKCAGINLDWRRARPAFMERCGALGMPVFLWTVDRPADMRRTIELGADSLTTNRPDLLLPLLGRAAPAPDRR